MRCDILIDVLFRFDYSLTMTEDAGHYRLDQGVRPNRPTAWYRSSGLRRLHHWTGSRRHRRCLGDWGCPKVLRRCQRGPLGSWVSTVTEMVATQVVVSGFSTIEAAEQPKTTTLMALRSSPASEGIRFRSQEVAVTSTWQHRWGSRWRMGIHQPHLDHR